MRNRYFTLIIMVVLIFSLTACGTKKEVEKVENPVQTSKDVVAEVEPEKPAEEIEKVEEESDEGLLVVGETINKGDSGSGPVKIDSGLTQIFIPEGLDYNLYMSFVDGNTGSIRVDFGIGNRGAGHIEVTTTRMIKSLDDAANECIRMNDFGTLKSEIGDEVIYGDLTYKYVTIKETDETNVKNYLVAYYKRSDDKDIYVELRTNGGDSYYKMDIDDPLVGELLKALVLK